MKVVKFTATLANLIIFLIGLYSPCITNASVIQILESNKYTSNKQNEFEICWLGKANSETQPLRELLQNYLYSELQNRAGLIIKIYEDCLSLPDPFHPIGIAFFDAQDNPPGIQNTILGLSSHLENKGHPTTFFQGKWSNKNLIDIILTSKFQEVNRALRDQVSGLSPSGKLNLIKSIALHEILHALGFAHEQDHPQSNCAEEHSPSNRRLTAITEYDSLSVMNHCFIYNFNFNKMPIPLSELDIAGIRKVYFP